MNVKTKNLVQRRQRMLQQLASLNLLTHASFLERFSTCSRKNCACHQGKKHGPRSYVVIYRDGKQQQVYVPNEQVKIIQKGLKQYEQAMKLIQKITDINLKLMREGMLQIPFETDEKGKPK